MNKIVLGIIIVIISVTIALWMGYSEKVDELIYANRQNTNLASTNEVLEDTAEKNKLEIQKLIVQLKQTQLLLERREKALKELQADVYKQFKNLEMLGQYDPAVRDALRTAIPDGVWAEIFGHESCNQDTDDTAKGAIGTVEAIPGTSP